MSSLETERSTTSPQGTRPWFFEARRFIYRYTSFVPKASLELRFRLLQESSFSYGKIVFRGPMSFLNAAQRAVSVIVSNDQNLADDIAQFDLIFWYFPKASTEIGGYFSIGDDYFDWGVDGVLTRIIVTCFTMRAVGNELFVCPKRNSYLNQIPAIYEAAAEWLERTGTRQELVSAIRDEARRIYTTQRCAGLDGEE